MQGSTRSFAFGAFAIVLCSACATGAAGTQDFSLQQARTIGEPSRSGSASDVLTADELMKANVLSTAEGVRRLRPEFLRVTQVVGVDGPSQVYPSVYVNGMYAGRSDALGLIALDAVEEIRYIRPSQAKDWWGAYCPCAGGVIYVRARPAK